MACHRTLIVRAGSLFEIWPKAQPHATHIRDGRLSIKVHNAVDWLPELIVGPGVVVTRYCQEQELVDLDPASILPCREVQVDITLMC